MCPEPSSWGYLMWRALVGSGRLGSGCLVLRADTRENPRGKNGVMTLTLHSDAMFMNILYITMTIYYLSMRISQGWLNDLQ